MAEKETLMDELRDAVGREGKSVVVEVDKSLVRRFAEAVGDGNPLWQDERYAKASKYGGMVVPPYFFCASMMSGSGGRPEVLLPFDRMLDGGGDWEFLASVKVGDVITSTTRFADLREKDGKTGKMLFLTFETVHKNQHDDVVAKSRGTLINLE